jgi:hypothetical protein
MMQNHLTRLLESVSNRHVGLFRHISTPKLDFSRKFHPQSKTFPTCSNTWVRLSRQVPKPKSNFTDRVFSPNPLHEVRFNIVYFLQK